MPSLKDSTEEGVPGSGLLHRAVPRITMVAGLNPPVIIFYCTKLDTAACYNHFWVLLSFVWGWLCSVGLTQINSLLLQLPSPSLVGSL